MKVILQRDVAKVGRRFDVVEVPSGHAQNFLIPRGIAIPATEVNLQKVTEQKKRTAEKRGEDAAAFEKTLHEIKGTTLQMSVEANPSGGLFKGIKADAIAAFLNTQGHQATPAHINLPEPIKHTGSYTIELRAGDHSGTFTLVLIPQ